MINDNLMKILQHADVSLATRRKNNVTIIQNVVVNKEKYNIDPSSNPFLMCLEIAPEENRLEWVIAKMIEAACATHPTKAAAAKYLGIDRRSAYFRKEIEIGEKETS